MTLKIISTCSVAVFSACVCAAQPYFVSPAGDDANPGTLEKPFATLQRAQQVTRQKHGDVFLRGGTYYLPAPLVFGGEDSGTKEAPVIFQDYKNETTANIPALLRQVPAPPAGSSLKIGVSRDQNEMVALFAP